MLTICLVILAIASRLLVHAPQFTAILAVAMFAGMYLSRRQALIVPVCVMMVTDLILGFHDTMAFTWGSMMVISLLGVWLKSHKSVLNVFGGSLACALIFFLITNFGAWLTMYPRTWVGLSECYTLALPFFRSTVLSTVAYSLVLYVGYEAIIKYSRGTVLEKLI